jgi:hypothetical protein
MFQSKHSAHLFRWEHFVDYANHTGGAAPDRDPRFSIVTPFDGEGATIRLATP